MHEILAPLYHAVDFDSVTQSGNIAVEDSELGEICSRFWIAADAWMLFDAVMRGISKWYEWRVLPSIPTTEFMSPAPSLHCSSPHRPVDVKPFVAPIVTTCDRIQSHLLRITDPLLFRHMQAVGIEPQIYGM